MAGTIALVGGGEWTDGCSFDAALLAASGGTEVVVLPTAAAFEQPDRAVATATSWFESLGGAVRGLHVLNRRDALDPANVDAVRAARFVYLSGGSPLHLRSVIKETPLWDALVDAWNDGAVVAGSSAGAMVLGDPMIDPRGGAFTLGLGLVRGLALVTEAETWSAERLHRTLKLANTAVACVPTGGALIRRDSGWEQIGDVVLQGELPA